MTGTEWAVVLGLTAFAFATRLAGVLGGEAIARSPRLSRALSDMPGGLLAGLVGAALATGGAAEWIAALLALAASRWGIIAAMAAGMAAVAALRSAGL